MQPKEGLYFQYLFHSESPLFRDVPHEDGEAKAKELECLFSEASAKAGYNVKVFCLSLRIVPHFLIPV